MYQVTVVENHRTSKVHQIVDAFIRDMDRGILQPGTKLPSINQFSEKNRVARDTIEKAYRQLKIRGYITSDKSRGYFVLGRHRHQLKVLLVFDQLCPFKKIIYDAILDSLEKKVKVDVQIHHHDPGLLRDILDSSLGRYDFYLIMPHFFSASKPKDYLPVLSRVPPQQLILLDKHLPRLGGSCKSVYRDFQHDIYEALHNGSNLLNKYQEICMILPQKLHYRREIIKGVETFCREQYMVFRVMDGVSGEAPAKGAVYMTAEEDDLVQLLKQMRGSPRVLGKDTGIISLNDSIFKELLDITVIATDFAEMGMMAAQFIRGRQQGACKSPFRFIPRGSL
jgi:DNA-binding transcriptional regulator YhcF (GntR family)